MLTQLGETRSYSIFPISPIVHHKIAMSKPFQCHARKKNSQPRGNIEPKTAPVRKDVRTVVKSGERVKTTAHTLSTQIFFHVRRSAVFPV